MEKKHPIPVDIEIDRLTNSIQNRLTGEVFDTNVTPVTDKQEVQPIEWVFDWEAELKDATKEIYKLTTINNPQILQGLLSI